jgi:Hepatocellular carcinoma-associated antigen 59
MLLSLTSFPLIRMAYIEEEMKKRRGEGDIDDQTSAEAKESRGYHDIYDELYKIPDHLRVRNSQ